MSVNQINVAYPIYNIEVSSLFMLCSEVESANPDQISFKHIQQESRNEIMQDAA
ncbi:MAG: hypothetical protein ACI832_000299 [Rheinheimera aquimaris]|jgi:hypothetical protein|uniref:hypothetical protein n=1 Tax=Rheinheimera aquimaris TaxID=412437 RepID=UPI0032B14A5E